MITVHSVRKSYGPLEVLKGVSMEVKKGEVVCIVGASGAGKSTLLHAIGTLDRADSGNIVIDGVDVTALRGRELDRFRNRKIGFVFQFHHLLPEFTALENVCIPAWIAGEGRQPAKKRAAGILEKLGLGERLSHRPSELSGGEQQRVAVARALVNGPAVVLADEPSGNLDSQNASSLHELFFRLRDENEQTFVIVTHNDALAAKADRKLVIKDGVIEGGHVPQG